MDNQSFSSDPTDQPMTDSENYDEYSYSDGTSGSEDCGFGPKPKCQLKPQAERIKALFRIGCTGQDVRDQMMAILEKLVEDGGLRGEWTGATKAYNVSNGNAAFAKGKEQSVRDELLLQKRWQLIRRAIGENILPEQHVKFIFARKDAEADWMRKEWDRNNGEGDDKVLGRTYSWRAHANARPDTIKVTIYVYERENMSFNYSRMRNYTGTLLHEIVHAFFGLYACNCTSCEDRDLATEGHPKSGHGPVWMELSLEMEKMMGRVFKFKCWLGRSAALAAEAYITGYSYSRQEIAVFQVNRRIYRQFRRQWSPDDIEFVEDQEDRDHWNDEGLETDKEEREDAETDDEGEDDEDMDEGGGEGEGRNGNEGEDKDMNEGEEGDDDSDEYEE